MNNITLIYLMLSFFIYIILCSVVYIVGVDIYNNRFNKKVMALKDSFGEEVIKQLNFIRLNKKLSEIDIEYVRSKIKRTHYMKVFYDTIVEFNKGENHEFTKIYMTNFEDVILANMNKYKKKDSIRKSYFAVMLGEYKLNNFEINEFLFNCIDTKSMYLRVSALRAISKIGNKDNFIKALVYISDNNKYVNHKIFIDILDQFEGDKNLLNKNLISKFDLFNENVQKYIVEHLKNEEVIFAREKLLEMLKSKKYKKEVNISIVKYFTKVKYEESKFELIKMLNQDDWEYRAICAIALRNYKSEDTIEALVNSVSDKNWYVRYNSSLSLIDFEDESIIDNILKKNDKYSIDIIFYAMFMKNRISYEEYLEKSRKLEVAC